jgi:hypothetical protein
VAVLKKLAILLCLIYIDISYTQIIISQKNITFDILQIYQDNLVLKEGYPIVVKLSNSKNQILNLSLQ